MLTKEQNATLTLAGPGTPGGELLRRFWQPIALVKELPNGGDPLPIDILGEELVLFRDETNRIGLLDRHCCHRGSDLSYGRVECGGLRCLYHGWLYDVNGHCLEQPLEPKVSTYKDQVRQPSYPVIERAGAFFAYMGPGAPPEFRPTISSPIRQRMCAPTRFMSIAIICRPMKATTILLTSACCTARLATGDPV
jgi:phthalate 4,5-dioxygenase